MTNGQWRNRIVSNGVAEPDQLLANPANWRIHPRNQQDALTGVLDEVGYVQDVIVNLRTSEDWPTGERGVETLVDGHLRVALAMRHNEPQIPVKYVDLSPHEEALILATLDPISALAAPDAAKLDAVLREVKTGSEYVQTLLDDLAHDAGLNYGGAGDADADPQLDRAAELNQKWQVKAGDLWRIGEHRLLCGDSTRREDVERVMVSDRACLVVTDPPYGVSYADKNKFLNAISRANHVEKPIENDHGTKEETQAMWRAAFAEMSAVMSPGAVVYCFMPQGGDQMMMMMMMMGAGIEPRHELIWLKNNHVLGRVDYAYKHEPILYAWKDGGHKFYGGFQTSILEFPKPQLSDLHPTMKPVKLIERLVSNSSNEAEIVYDQFCGSGTTLVACQNLQRKCRGIEISPDYCAVILERMATAFPGIEIERISSV